MLTGHGEWAFYDPEADKAFLDAYANRLVQFMGPTPMQKALPNHHSSLIVAKRDGRRDDEILQIEPDRMTPQARNSLLCHLVRSGRTGTAFQRYPNLVGLLRPPEGHCWWYTAEETVRATARGLTRSEGEATRWLVEGINFLADARDHDDLYRCLVPPHRSIDKTWDTFIAGAFQYRLRTMGLSYFDMPWWTRKRPLAKEFVPGSRTLRGYEIAAKSTPDELRGLNVFFPVTALEDGAKPPRDWTQSRRS